MAKAQVKMPEEFLMKLSRLGEKTDEIIPRVLKAGGELVADKVRANLQSVIGKGTKPKSRSTGTLVSSLGVSPARLDKDGNFNVKVGFSEPHGDGKSNAMLAGVLEYGKHGQSAKPFLKPAISASKNACINKMISTFEKEMESL